MKNTLLVTAVFGLLALSQTVQAHDAAPTEAIRTVQPATVQQQAAPRPALEHAGVHLAQVTTPVATAARQPEEDEGTMPSVAYGLIGLLLMICVLVKRHNDPVSA